MAEHDDFVRMPAALVYDTSITPAAKVCWLAMQSQIDTIGGPIDFRHIADALGTSVSAVGRWYWALEHAGWVDSGWTWGSGWDLTWWTKVLAARGNR